MEAASGGYHEVGRVLINKGADVNAAPVPSSRDTALTIAADKGHYRWEGGREGEERVKEEKRERDRERGKKGWGENRKKGRRKELRERKEREREGERERREIQWSSLQPCIQHAWHLRTDIAGLRIWKWVSAMLLATHTVYNVMYVELRLVGGQR